MAFLRQKYEKILQRLSGKSVTLVAVSKTKTREDILEAYEAGIRDFGENYVQELLDKQASLPGDIHWHFIGHLQTNKVKYIAAFVHLVHAVDSARLLAEINKQGKKINRVIPCLLQLHISKDETKFGFDEDELDAMIQQILTGNNFSHVSVRGLMGMATFTEDNALIAQEFSRLKKMFDKLQQRLQSTNMSFDTLSMGMSADYMIAVQCGSNMVRVGSLLFGERRYAG